ncbi:MAG: trypsin-like peptidase domain-containing protein [Candidatus Hadarchaeum sp.]|uniref:trypsin-like peptidase domain-containing protein n=1 Tax=Candidatus Hadarchaeum sp. TaxID=2883567 RepID=UPI003D11FD1D
MPRRRGRYSGRLLIGLIVVALLVGVFAGAVSGYAVAWQEVKRLQDQVSSLSDQVADLENQVSSLSGQIVGLGKENVVYLVQENFSLPDLYEKVKDAVVVIRSTRSTGVAQGSGFWYSFEGQPVIVTNYHVVNGATEIVVTLRNGNAYPATLLGSDPYADLAVLSVSAPKDEIKTLEIVSSSTLKVGDTVVAVGNPYGLTGSMTVGIVSQLGRTLQESTIGNYSIANIIQTSAPINPGNSGGPLLNVRGEVVGITTAIVADSQGLGFAVPSNTILREIGSLIKTGSYNKHPWLGILGRDMDYEIARAMNVDVTYGWLVVSVVPGGPADKAGLRGGTKQYLTSTGTLVTIGGDILIAIDGHRIITLDDLLSYLEEYTAPGQVVEFTVVRNNTTIYVSLELGARPPPS